MTNFFLECRMIFERIFSDFQLEIIAILKVIDILAHLCLEYICIIIDNVQQVSTIYNKKHTVLLIE